jgi:hypothetical protein
MIGAYIAAIATNELLIGRRALPDAQPRRPAHRDPE